MAESTLSLDPNDAANQELVADWVDGGEYVLTIKQTAPFKFDVISESEAEPAEEAAEEAGDEKPMHPMGKKYPRIAVLIGGKEK